MDEETELFLSAWFCLIISTLNFISNRNLIGYIWFFAFVVYIILRLNYIRSKIRRIK